MTRLKVVAEYICKDIGFILIEMVGFGAFKETFHVRNAEGISFALKVFKSNNSTERTKREIVVMQKCEHRNIVNLIEVDTVQIGGEEYLYLLEDYLGGGTLTRRIEEGSLNHEDIIEIGKSLVSAIKHLQDNGFVHRDIKPDNIMFEEDSKTPILVDFGLVRDLSDTSLTHTWMLQGPGSPLYSSPEQLNNEKHLIDWRSDQFSLGVTLSISYLGLHPYSYENDSSSDVVTNVAIRKNPNPLFAELCEKVNLTVLKKMVAPWPVNRYRNAGELLLEWEKLGGDNRGSIPSTGS